MSKLQIKVGSTSVTINVFIQDSTVTTGAGKTGLAFNTGSFTCYYALPAAAPVAVSLATQTATGAYSSGGFVELDSTHCPGLYRFDIPNAALASGRFSNIYFLLAGTIAPCVLEIELTGYDNTLTPGATGAMLIAGTNSGATSFTGGLTVSNAGGDALTLTSSGGNGNAINATGNGTGNGAMFTSGAGATGDGFKAVAASTNGNGMKLTKAGTGLDLNGSILDGVTVESGVNARQALSLLAAAHAGLTSGGGTSTFTIKGANVATTRMVATVDANGNRTANALTIPS